MEGMLARELRLSEWPLLISGPAALGAAILVTRTMCRSRWEAADSDTGPGNLSFSSAAGDGSGGNRGSARRKRSSLALGERGSDVDSLYRVWCGGDRQVEEELCGRLQSEISEGIARKDVLHVTHLLGVAQHIPSFDKKRIKEFEADVAGWRTQRYGSLLALMKYAKPRVEVVTVVAVLNAFRPILWEYTKQTDEALSAAAKTADLPPFVRHAVRYVLFSAVDSTVQYAINYLKRQEEENFTMTVKGKLVNHLLTLDLEYFNTHKTHLTEFSSDVEKLRHLVTDRIFQVIHFSTIAVHSVRVSMQSRGQALVTLACLFAAPTLYVLKDLLNTIEGRVDGVVTGQVVGRKSTSREPELTVSGLLKRLMVIRCGAAEDHESAALMEEEVACMRDNVFFQTVGELSLTAVRGTVIPNLFVLYLVAVGHKVADMSMLEMADIPQTAENAIEAFDHVHSLIDEVFDFADSTYTLRLTSLLETQATIDTGGGDILTPEEETGHLWIDGISFRYPGTETEVLSNVSWSLEHGTKLAIVGQTGCGKSTLASLLIRLYDTDSGCVRYCGRDIKDLNVRWLRRRIATVQQSVRLPPGSVLNSFTYGLEGVDMDAVIEVSKLLGLHRVISSLREGYDTRIGGSMGATFSGGQTQRIAICRALLSRPNILILDEATNGLDPMTERIVLKQVILYLGGASLIMISHRASTAQSCDIVLCLDKGTVCESGSFHQLMERNGETAKLFLEEQEDSFYQSSSFSSAHSSQGSPLKAKSSLGGNNGNHGSGEHRGERRRASWPSPQPGSDGGSGGGISGVPPHPPPPPPAAF
eukprot:Rhum_TRINITY_DN11737_c2_g1::Rhum_TRINITY_DN11737_c2_g1_i1::g.46835::m.46835